METCVRGFSFMPTETVSAECLQYIEGEELTRKWRESRRERKKQREQKIWEEFVVNENDVLSTMCKDDPYQFLEQLPEECLKELMEVQLKEMQKETIEEEVDIEERQEQQEQLALAAESAEEGDLFTIYDDKDENPSGAESPSPPSTVRALTPDPALSPEKASSKSSENVTNVIENSIYFAKVKDLRIKISEELANIVLSLERRDVLHIEPDALARTCRRADEFAGRFARVHVYQLNRQIAELERHNSLCLPFGQHTHFQAQMTRIASLHQNMLQAFQVFNRSIDQTACLKDSIESLRVLVTLCRQGVEASRRHLTAAGNIDDDIVEQGCSSVERALSEHAACVHNYMLDMEQQHSPQPGPHARRSKRSLASCASHNSVSATRFSMYSLDTMRIKLKPKPSKGISSDGTSKARGAGRDDVTPRSKRSARKKSPKKSRRPLMRAPNSGRQKSKRKESKEADIPTMVQSVPPLTCTSSRASVPSPRSPRRSKDSSGRLPRRAPPLPSAVPRSPHAPPSPRRDFKRRPASPPMKKGSMQAALSSVASEVPAAAPALRPVIKSDKNKGPGKLYKKPDSARTSETCQSALRLAIESPRTKMETFRSNYTPRHAPETSRVEHDRHQTEHRTEYRAEHNAEPAERAAEPSPRLAVKAELLTSEQRCEIAARERTQCTSSRVSCVPSPRSPRHSKDSSARLPRLAPPPPAARSPRAPPSPRREFKRRPASPLMKKSSMQAALSSVVSEVPAAALRPVIKSDKNKKLYKLAEQRTEDRGENRPEEAWEAQHSRSEPAERAAEPSPRLAVKAELLTSEQRCEMAARERTQTSSVSERCEVTRIVRQLCGGDSAGNRGERVCGAKNAQLVCVSSSPRQPSTPQLLRILEETIQKKVPKQLLPASPKKTRERHRLAFNIGEVTADRLFQYRTRFLQHMLASPLYANSQLGKPWEAVSRISDKIIDDLLANCAKEIQMEDALERLYNVETR